MLVRFINDAAALSVSEPSQTGFSGLFCIKMYLSTLNRSESCYYYIYQDFSQTILIEPVQALIPRFRILSRKETQSSNKITLFHLCGNLLVTADSELILMLNKHSSGLTFSMMLQYHT